MHHFEVGESVESVDTVGHWALSHVLEVREQGYVVSFDGWNRKWNRYVTSSEIRSKTETCQVPRRSSVKRKEARVSTLHVEKGDVVHLSRDDDIIDSVVLLVDPFNNTLVVETNGVELTVSSDDIVAPASVHEYSRGHTNKRRRIAKQKNSVGKTTPQSYARDSSGKNSSTPSQIGGEDSQTVLTENLPLPSALGANSFVSVGDICSFALQFVIVIKSIFTSGANTRASCLICKVENNQVLDLYHDSSLECPTSRLYSTTKLKSSTKTKRMITSFINDNLSRISLAVQKNNTSSVYHMILRKVRLCNFMCQHIRKLLRSKSMIKSFETVSSDYDSLIFNTDGDQNNLKQFYVLEDGYEKIDSLFYPKWDVYFDSSDPTNKYSFVRGLTLKIDSCKITVTIVKAVSIEPYSENYRELSLRAIAASKIRTEETASSSGLFSTDNQEVESVDV